MAARAGFFRSDDQPLTRRQLEVLAGAAAGEFKKQTARRLGLTVEGVRSHHRDIRMRLDANTITHAVAIAYAKGLLT